MSDWLDEAAEIVRLTAHRSDSIELSRRVETEAGVAKYHKPIGTELGSGGLKGAFNKFANSRLFVASPKSADKHFAKHLAKSEQKKKEGLARLKSMVPGTRMIFDNSRLGAAREVYEKNADGSWKKISGAFAGGTSQSEHLADSVEFAKFSEPKK